MLVKVGDLVRVPKCDNDDPTCEGTLPGNTECGCWFCSNDSSGIGMITKRMGGATDPLATIAPDACVKHGGYWSVLFDVGEWRLYGKEMEIINEK